MNIQYGGNRLNRQTMYLPTVSVAYGLPQFSTMFGTSASSITSIPFQINGTPNSAAHAFQSLSSLQTLPVVDYSQCTSFQYFTDGTSALTSVDLTTAQISSLTVASWLNAFGNTGVQSIVSMPLNENFTGTTPPPYNATFTGATALTTISFRGKFGASVSFANSTLAGTSVLNIIWALSSTHTGTLTMKSSPMYSSAYVKLNTTGDGLVFCESTDPDTLGTVSAYITSKGWTLTTA